MSIHGNQILFPSFLRKGTHLPPIGENDELTIAFHQLTKDIKAGEKIISFSRLLWPLLSIPGIISTHIFLDGLMIFSKRGKFSNPPRQPLIGHLLRNIDNLNEIDQLNKIIDVLTYKDTAAQEIGKGEDSEFQNLVIEGLINPETLQALKILIPYANYQPITDYMPLDAKLSTDNAIDISQQYRNTIEMMKGNSYRWKTQIDLIGRLVEKKLTGLNVQLSDIKTRYSSQIKKAALSIDNTQVEQQKVVKSDRIENWKVEEKKKVIENITTLFLTCERDLENMIKRNKFFIRNDTLKSKVFEDVIPTFKNHFQYLKNQGNNFLQSLDELYVKFEEIARKGAKIDFEASQSIKKHEADLHIQLQDRNKQLSTFEGQKDNELLQLEEYRRQMEVLYDNIKEIIQNKSQLCLQEADELKKYGLDDQEAELFSRPILWVYMPVYAMFLEDEDMMEERMNIVFPGYIGESNSLYTEVSDIFVELKKYLLDLVEDDMVVRSNFEFSSDSKNLLKDPNLRKKIQMGLSVLRNQSLIDIENENKLRNNLKLIP
jgi:phage host-nuclease inhibitor protein Gam